MDVLYCVLIQELHVDITEVSTSCAECLGRETITKLKDFPCMPSFSGTRVPLYIAKLWQPFFLWFSSISFRNSRSTICVDQVENVKIKEKHTCPSARGMLTNGTLLFLCWGTDLLLFNMLWTRPLGGKVLETVCCNPALEYKENVTLRLTFYALLEILKHEANASSRKYT